MLTDGFLRLLGRYALIPVAALYAMGLLGAVTLRREETVVALGYIRFSVMTLIRGAIAGTLLFWLGSWSNRQSADYIKAQPALRPTTRALAVTAARVAIFGAAVLLLMSILGIDLTAGAVLGGALGVGIGLGLQQIAASFVPGIILLVEGRTTVGALPFVLRAPDGPDCDLWGFGESRVDFAVASGGAGLDGGRNKYGSPVLVAIWDALKARGTTMPYPRRVVALRHG